MHVGRWICISVSYLPTSLCKEEFVRHSRLPRTYVFDSILQRYFSSNKSKAMNSSNLKEEPHTVFFSTSVCPSWAVSASGLSLSLTLLNNTNQSKVPRQWCKDWHSYSHKEQNETSGCSLPGCTCEPGEPHPADLSLLKGERERSLGLASSIQKGLLYFWSTNKRPNN
jgi:hypothetical protein